MVFGGVSPVPLRFILDVITLGCLFWTNLTPLPVETSHSTVVFFIPYLLTAVTAGATSRWTLSFPMVPVALFHILRLTAAAKHASTWVSTTIRCLSVLVICISTLLCVLFPVVELPSVDGPYNVGVLDFYLPVQDQLSDDKRGHDNTPFSPHISVRLLYPTLDKPNGIPYLNPLVAKEYCRELMRFGAPLPLKKHDWFLHTWRLMRLRVRSRAQLIEQPEKLPLVFFSHGLGGTSEIYSYQTMALASNGHLVVSINHEDGSAPAVKKYNGSLLTYNHDLAASWMNNDHGAYVRKRRAQTDHRATEFISAVEAFLQLNDQDNNDLSQAGIALRNRLDKEQCTFMGHSFGGATALVAANRRTDLVKRVIAHEPAIDWMTDDARRSLFAEYVIKDLSHSYVGGTGGYETSHDEEDGPSVHDLDLLLLYSNEWVDKRWGESHIVADVFRSGRLGQRGGASRFEMIQDSHHMEFSDVSLITPPWLAGGTKKRTSHEIAIEISRMTSRWIDRSRLTT